MSRDVFLGILTGMAEARGKEQENLLTQERERRKTLADFWLKQAENPNVRPEAQDLAMQKYLGIVQSPLDKKLGKGLDTLDDFLQVPVRDVGSPSWLGGETTRQIEAQPMPVPATLAPPRSAPSPVGPGLPFGGIQNEPEPRRPGLAASAPAAPTHTPLPPTALAAPMPPPPPGLTMPARYTERELFDRAARVERMKTDEEIRQATRIAEAQEQARLRLAKQQPPKLGTFGHASSGIYNELTGEIMREPLPPPDPREPASKAIRPVQVIFKGGTKPQVALFDPDSGNFFVPDANDPSKRVNVTGEVESIYEQPRQTSPSLDELEQLRQLDLEERTKAAPGQLVYAATDRPVRASTVGDVAAARLAGFQDARDQVVVVKEMLQRLGSSGAIKGWVLEHGLYWPVVQDKITPDQAALVSETQRLVNAYLYAVSGKQINEQEMARIARTAPSTRFPPQVNLEILNHFDRYLETQERNYLKTRGWKYLGATDRPPEDKPPKPPPGTVEEWERGPDGKLRRKPPRR